MWYSNLRYGIWGRTCSPPSEKTGGWGSPRFYFVSFPRRLTSTQHSLQWPMEQNYWKALGMYPKIPLAVGLGGR